jgi:prophage regulatory protein
MQTFLRLPEIKKITGLSKMTIYRKMGRGEFPRPWQLSNQAVGWLEQEVEEWMKTRAPATRLSRHHRELEHTV